MKKIIFFFLDGFGLAPAGHDNYFSGIAGLQSGLPVLGYSNFFGRSGITAADACLGVPGFPQSATGQTSLFTGINSQKELGCHKHGFPGKTLGDIIDSGNILIDSKSSGYKPCFANAFSEKYFEDVYKGRRKHSVTTRCAISAGLDFMTEEDLVLGNSVYWDITGKGYPSEKENFIDPEEAAGRLIRLLERFDLVLFESILTDRAGHLANRDYAEETARILSAFIKKLMREADLRDYTFLLTSDHGNAEDISTKGHTMNSVPVISAGKGCELFMNIKDITEVRKKMNDFWRK
ncbi:MAG: alkaline phosphatase family protein [Fibrobacterota bacterium]